jgi:hypothetical protein
MNVRRAVLFAFAAVLLLAAVRAGPARLPGHEARVIAAADAQILSQVREHSEAMQKPKRAVIKPVACG